MFFYPVMFYLIFIYVCVTHGYRVFYILLVALNSLKHIYSLIDTLRGERNFLLFLFFKNLLSSLPPKSKDSLAVGAVGAQFDGEQTFGIYTLFPAPRWFHRSMHHVAHFRTLRILLSDPNVIRCSSCDIAH